MEVEEEIKLLKQRIEYLETQVAFLNSGTSVFAELSDEELEVMECEAR